MTAPRRARIADQIQRELAEVIRLELRDPRMGSRMVTVTGVEVSRDGSHAKIFFTVLGSPSEGEEARAALQRAAGFLRTNLSRRLTTWSVPELAFAYDESVERGVRLSRLIDDAVKTEVVETKPPPPKPARKPARKPRRKATL